MHPLSDSKSFRPVHRLSWTALGVVALAISAPAQDAPEVPPPAAPVTEPVPAKAPVAQVKSPEELRLAALLKVKFDRTPASILQAQTAVPKGDTPEARAIDEFRLHVVAGKWTDAGVYLKALPEKDAVQVYESLLKDLNRVSTGQDAQQQQVAGPTPSPTLLADDILALADISPTPLVENQIKLLGALLSRVWSASPHFAPLLGRLEAGTGKLGGADPAKRELAAMLLIHSGHDLEAAPFLGTLEPDTKSFPKLELQVRARLAVARTPKSKDTINDVWALNQRLIKAADCPADIRERAWERVMAMLPLLTAADASRFLNETFLKDPEQSQLLLSAVAVRVGKERSNREPLQRKGTLILQRQITDALLSVAGQGTRWQPVLNLFATNWMDEAAYSKQLFVPPRTQNMQTDEFGNQIFYSNQSEQPQQQSYGSNQLPPIWLAEVLKSAPNDAWLAALDAGLKPRALILLAEAHLKLEEDTKALPYIEQLAQIRNGDALRLANELLRVWATLHDPQRVIPQRRSNIYYGMGSPYGNAPQGIPLTRALQQRNLEELTTLLARLHKLPIEPLEDAAVIKAFTMSHSQAEVFRQEAIEQVLGPVEKMKPETLSELLQTMRSRLASQWRKPSVQQQAKTQRTDSQIDTEVLRGYEVLGGLLQKGVEAQPNDWRLHLAQATTWFDWAEFQYGKKVDLAIYVEKRDRSFDAFQRAADLYATKLPSMEAKDETPVIYQQWLNANLGASDLGFVTRQQEASPKHLDRIRDTILALPGEAASRHLAALAKAVAGGAESLPAHLKAGYMRATLRIVGERPEAAEVSDLVTYYDGLLREVEVSLRVDGDATVGHKEPFGVLLTVRHSAEIERESSGGFGKFLRNQSQNPYYYNPFGTAPIDYRDELEKQIREKLAEGFEIRTLTFHDEKVQSRGYGRAGWRETPLVYLMLKAKDASVDRIPALRLDLDFVDKRGPVILPVESLVTLIDARPEVAEARPLRELEATQTLDDRTLGEGKLILEIKATAKGVVPDFKTLFDFTLTGFKIDEQTDSGPAVQRFDSAGDELAGVSERNWLIKLSALEGTGRSAKFQFPKPKLDSLKVTYKRYQDADLVEVAPELALSGLPLHPGEIWRRALTGAAGMAVLGWVIMRLRRKPAKVLGEVSYAMPAVVTPFTALELLRKIHSDPALKLTEEHGAELSKAIASIEAYHFSRKHNGDSAPDLDSIGRVWVSRARPGNS